MDHGYIEKYEKVCLKKKRAKVTAAQPSPTKLSQAKDSLAQLYSNLLFRDCLKKVASLFK